MKKAIGTLIADEKFKQEFLGNPDEVLSRFDMTDEEKEALKKITDKDLEAMEVNVEALAGVTERGPKIGIYIWS